MTYRINQKKEKDKQTLHKEEMSFSPQAHFGKNKDKSPQNLLNIFILEITITLVCVAMHSSLFTTHFANTVPVSGRFIPIEWSCLCSSILVTNVDRHSIQDLPV